MMIFHRHEQQNDSVLKSKIIKVELVQKVFALPFKELNSLHTADTHVKENSKQDTDWNFLKKWRR